MIHWREVESVREVNDVDICEGRARARGEVQMQEQVQVRPGRGE